MFHMLNVVFKTPLRFAGIVVVLGVLAISPHKVHAQNPIPFSGPETFTIGTSLTAALPTNWKADKNTTVRTVGTYSAAVTATERRAGNSMSATAANGIYNYGAGVEDTATDRAVGWISSSGGTQSGNLYGYFQNNTGAQLTEITVSYDVEKYRNGTNAAGFKAQMYYSTDGSAWTSAGATFLTSFAANADNNGFASAPGSTTGVSGQLVFAAPIANAGFFYLAWNYSVASGTTTTNAQGLGIDNVNLTSPLAAPLADFNAAAFGDHILVTWETVSEIGNLGFNLWRGTSPTAPDVQLNASLIPSQGPGSSQGFSYAWPDSANLVNNTTYYYWLEDVDIAGVVTRHGPVSATYSAPTAVSLSGFAPVTTLPVAWPLAAAGLTALAAAAVAWRRR